MTRTRRDRINGAVLLVLWASGFTLAVAWVLYRSGWLLLGCEASYILFAGIFNHEVMLLRDDRS